MDPARGGEERRVWEKKRGGSGDEVIETYIRTSSKNRRKRSQAVRGVPGRPVDLINKVSRTRHLKDSQQSVAAVGELSRGRIGGQDPWPREFTNEDND